jgi:predicted DNA-binding transcriptional regulator YafY
MKKSDTLLRHWRMLREIPRYPRRIGTPEILERLLAAGFDATLRTVQRDLIKLSASLPLLGDDSKPQGWSWQADAPQLDLPSLEPHTALVFHLAEQYLQALLPASTLIYLAPWFRTASGVLDCQGTALANWRNKVRVLAPGQPQLPPQIKPEVQQVITQGLLLEKRVDLRYRPRDATEDRQYEASLLGLVVRDHVSYLVCTLRDYSDVKQLVVSRIQSAELLEKPARALPGFDLDDYIAQGEFGIPLQRNGLIGLVLDVQRQAANTFIERPLTVDQRVEDVDEKTVRLSVRVPDTLELRRWILGFGPLVQVRSPSNLRNDLRGLIQEMQESYASE